jgi:hypothetical protein
MDWKTFISSALGALTGGGIIVVAAGSLIRLWLVHRLELDRQKLAEERERAEKVREASIAVADILGEWLRPTYTHSYTNEDRWRIQTTYWKHILRLDKNLVTLLLPCLANAPGAAGVNELIVEARRVLLDLPTRDLTPDQLNNWRPEPPTSRSIVPATSASQ